MEEVEEKHNGEQLVCKVVKELLLPQKTAVLPMIMEHLGSNNDRDIIWQQYLPDSVCGAKRKEQDLDAKELESLVDKILDALIAAKDCHDIPALYRASEALAPTAQFGMCMRSKRKTIILPSQKEYQVAILTIIERNSPNGESVLNETIVSQLKTDLHLTKAQLRLTCRSGGNKHEVRASQSICNMKKEGLLRHGKNNRTSILGRSIEK